MRERALNPERIRARFMAKVDQRSGPDGCWMWTAHVHRKTGYGRFGMFTRGKARALDAHRVSWELFVGEVPQGMDVCHRCDDRWPIDDVSYRKCVRPEHLFIGTRKDNQQHMVAMGRSCRGERLPQAKLTTEAVVQILQAIAAKTTTQTALAKLHGVSLSCINRVAMGKDWRHVRRVP